MPDPATLGLFLAASVLLILTPGPDLLFVISQGLAAGRGSGVAAALGIAAGNIVHTAAATLGVSALIAASPPAFATIKWLGVAYLLWLAIGSLRAPQGDVPAQSAVHRGVFRRGLLMNALNPKVMLFFLAFLPQFADAQRGPVWVQMLGYGLLFMLLVAVICSGIALMAARVNAVLAGRGGQRFRQVGNYLVTCVYAGLAARLALV